LEMTCLQSSRLSGSNFDVNATSWTCELGSGQQTHESILGRSKGYRNECSGAITTLLLRNVPRHYTEAAIASELEACVDRCEYDLIYLPWDIRKGTNIGFVFINFVSEVVAARVYKKMDGAHWRVEQTDKVIKIMPAHRQGLAASIAHFASTRAADEFHQHAPMVFVKGSHIAFQEAVKLFCFPGLLQNPKGIAAAHVDMDELCAWERRCSLSSNSWEMFGMNNTSHLGKHVTMPVHHDVNCEIEAMPFSVLCHSTDVGNPFPKTDAEPVDVRSSIEYHTSWRQINVLLGMLLGSTSFQNPNVL